MWPFRKKTEIEILGDELENLHSILGIGNKRVNREIFERIKMIEDTLLQISKKNNGLEY